MKQLILMRHAKSSWPEPSIADKDRSLNDRGQANALTIGTWMAAKGLQPDQVLSSTATRCRETWAGVQQGLAPVGKVEFLDGLYLATEREMLDILHGASGETVLMLGHMPGLGDFARDMRQDPPPHHDQFRKYPTGAVTVLRLHLDNWAQAQFGDADLESFTSPAQM